MRIKIPLSAYTDDVKRIITTQYESGYTSVLAGCKKEDLQTALDILREKDMLNQKQKAIERELEYREHAKEESSQSLQGKEAEKFKKEWNEMLLLFRKAQKERNTFCEHIMSRFEKVV